MAEIRQTIFMAAASGVDGPTEPVPVAAPGPTQRGSAGQWGMPRPVRFHVPSSWRKGSAPLSSHVSSQAMPWCLKSLQHAPPLGKQGAWGFLAKMQEVGF